MTLEELSKQLKTTGLPVTYRDWPENEPVPDLPFICYLCPEYDSLYADGGNYYTFAYVKVELYAVKRDPQTEAKVEAALAGFHWKKSETYISTERCYKILYEIEV